MQKDFLSPRERVRFVVEKVQTKWGILDRAKGFYTQIENKKSRACEFAKMLNKAYGY